MSALEFEEKHLANLKTTTCDENINRFIPLFDKIPWDDVLIPMVARRYLSLKDLFSLRCCCRKAKTFAETVLEQRKQVNLAGNNSKNIALAFRIISEKCHRLDSLYLARCHWLTDKDLYPVLKENPKLRVVNLNECVNLTSNSLQPIIIKCKELKILKLSKCQWMTPGAIEALTLHQSKLEEVDISHCSTIGERCLCTFFGMLNKLTILSLAYVPSVTDAVLMQIANYCRDLEHINLVSCSAITDYGIIALTTNCTKLKSLMIQRCPNITERTLSPLRNRIHLDRPKQSLALPPLVNFLYLQV